MRKNRKEKGTLLGVEIATARPEDSREALAIKIADSLQIEMNARQDAMEYRGQAQRERQKAKSMIGVLTMLQEYNRDKKKKLEKDPDWETKPPYEGGPSRMEPMASYDEDDLKKQKVEAIQRAKQFDELAIHYESIAKKAKQSQEQLQRQIRSGDGGVQSRFISFED